MRNDRKGNKRDKRQSEDNPLNFANQRRVHYFVEPDEVVALFLMVRKLIVMVSGTEPFHTNYIVRSRYVREKCRDDERNRQCMQAPGPAPAATRTPRCGTDTACNGEKAEQEPHYV